METEEIYHVAVDGPVASGKGAVTRELSKRLGIPCLDTGAMYRGTAVFLTECTDITDEEAVNAALSGMKMEVSIKDNVTKIKVNGRDITEKLRENQISSAASIVAAYQAVREKLVSMQQQIAKQQSFILEGRDICNVVLPEAKYKFFLTASVKTRAGRRLGDLESKGQKFTLSEIVKQVKARDKNDREKGGFKKVRGAAVIDNTKLSVSETADRMAAVIAGKKNY